MRDGEDGAVAEGDADHRLQQRVRAQIDRRRRFVQRQDARATQLQPKRNVVISASCEQAQ